MTTPHDPYGREARRRPSGPSPGGSPYDGQEEPYNRQEWPGDQPHHQHQPAHPQPPSHRMPEAAPYQQSNSWQAPPPGYLAPGYRGPYPPQQPDAPRGPYGYQQPPPFRDRLLPGSGMRQPPPPNRHRGLMAAAGITVGVIVLAALGFYVTRGRGVGRPAAAAATTASCRQQYQAWKYGPARPDGKKLAAALNGVQSAGTSDDITLMRAGLKRAGRIAHRLQAYPMPHCADPAGYWAQTVADIRASGDNAGAATGLMGLIAAEVPLKKVPALEHKLQAEVKSTAGVS